VPSDSPKDTRLCPIVTSFRGHSFVIVSGSGRGSELAGRGSVGRSGIGSRLIPCRPSKGSGLSRLAGWLAWSGYLIRYGLGVRASRK